MMTFEIIRHRGTLQVAKIGNVTIRRSEGIFIPEWGAIVRCAPYDNHFIFESPHTALGSPAHQCTCGSPAVVTPPGPAGLFVCLFHATNGFHTTSFVDKKDFKEVAGEGKVIDPKGGKRWV